MATQNCTHQSLSDLQKTCLTSCPTEILSLIADQAHLQDQAFRTDSDAKTLLHANDVDSFTREDPYHFIKQKEWKWYGKSTMALGSTCTVFRKLCLPFLFKILPLSKTTTGLFYLYFKKQHGKSFETVVFDVQEYSQTATKEFLLHALGDLSNIHSFIFNSYYCVDAWCEVIRSIEGTSQDLTSLPANEAIKQSSVRNVAQKINSLQLKDCEVEGDVISSFPSLETFELVRTKELHDSVLDQLGTLAACQKLTKIWLYLNPHRATNHIPATWVSLSWSESLTSLTLEIRSMADQDWNWLATIATHLETLDLQVFSWQVNSAPSKAYFPKLQTLELWMKLEDMPKLLSRMSATALTNLALYSRFIGEPFNDDIFTAVQPFKKTLDTFELIVRDIVLTNEQRASYDAFVSELPLAKDTSMQSISTPIWTRFTQRSFVPIEAMTEKNMEEAEEVLKYAGEMLRGARKRGDGAGVAEWMRWMAPLAARRTLEDQ